MNARVLWPVRGMNTTDDQIVSNIRSALARKLPELQPSPVPHDGTFVIVGSGPSLADHLKEVRDQQDKGRPIVAVKGAHEFLIKNGITPDIAIMMDAQPKRIECVRSAAEGVVYLIASQCDPVVFDHLQGRDVMLWHAYGGKHCDEAAPDAFWVYGGTTTGLRSIYVGVVLGFRRFILYGFDSSMRDGKRRVVLDEPPGSIHELSLHDGSKWTTNTAMASQTLEIQNLLNQIDIHVKAIGDGLLPHVLKLRAESGFPAWRLPE